LPPCRKPRKETKPTGKKKAAPKKTQIPADDVLSFEQKKDLSEAIQTLDGQKRVISWLCASAKPPLGKDVSLATLLGMSSPFYLINIC
jgi:hypothetical protein